MQLSVTSPLSLEETDTLCLPKRGLDPAGAITDLKSVPIRTTRLHQTQYVSQPCLERSNVFHKTS